MLRRRARVRRHLQDQGLVELNRGKHDNKKTLSYLKIKSTPDSMKTNLKLDQYFQNSQQPCIFDEQFVSQNHPECATATTAAAAASLLRPAL